MDLFFLLDHRKLRIRKKRLRRAQKELLNAAKKRLGDHDLWMMFARPSSVLGYLMDAFRRLSEPVEIGLGEPFGILGMPEMRELAVDESGVVDDEEPTLTGEVP
jgi:hypothetical protein